ncbi:MAG: oxidoreductase, partial [Chloroflexi bacterium]
DVIYTYTRQAPGGWTGYRRRIDRAMLKEITSQMEAGLRPYVCGPTLLVEAAANNLVELGIPADRIRTERFGPTGT